MSYITHSYRPLPFVVRYIAEVNTYRHLCWNLVGADLRTRFRRSHLGIIWAIIQPLAFSLTIALVWGSLMGAEDYWSFAIYVFSGIILWEYFGTVVVGAQDALISSEGYLRQTRIPFLIFQIRIPLTGMVILLCGVAGLMAMLVALGKNPDYGLELALVPLHLVLFLLFGIPIAIIMSILGTQFRDLKHISQIALQALFFLSPVMLGREILAQPKLAILQYVNPMVPFIDMFRAPILEGRFWTEQEVWTVSVWIGAFWVLAIFLSARAGRRLVYSL